MAFPLIPIIAAIPSLLTAVKTVKEISSGKKEVDIPKDAKDITEKDMNIFKRGTAIKVLIGLGLLEKIKKWGGDEDDLGVLVDFACFIYKVIAFKLRHRGKSV